MAAEEVIGAIVMEHEVNNDEVEEIEEYEMDSIRIWRYNEETNSVEEEEYMLNNQAGIPTPIEDEDVNAFVEMEIEPENPDGDEIVIDEDDQPLNPLLLPEILSHLLLFVNDTQTLVKIRAVSRMWKSEATKVIRKKHVVHLVTIQQLWSYCTTMRSCEDLPHEIFLLNVNLIDIDEFAETALNTFLTLFGPRIKHLKLILNERFSTSNDSWTVLYNCVNLEKLSVRVTRDFINPLASGDGGMTLFAKGKLPRVRMIGPSDLRYTQLAQIRNQITLPNDQLLPLYGPIAPQLQLKIKHIDVTLDGVSGNADNISDFFKILFTECESSLLSISCSTIHTDIYLGNLLYNSLIVSAVELGNGFGNLMNLNFWFKPTSEQLKELKRFKRLTHLKMVLGSSIRNDTFQKAIAPSSSTIKRLELIVQSPSSLKGPFAAPVFMQSLKYLKLFGHTGSGCLEFLRNTPVLEELHVLGMHLKFLIDELPRYRNPSGLKRLKILRSNGSMDPLAVSRITDSFNEVVSLELTDVTNGALDMIYQTMPNLQELKITGKFSDEGICGIPERTCEEIKELQAHFIADDTELRRFLFIGCLSKLKRLSIKSDVMTDISVMFGLTRLKKLEDLVIAGELITERSVEAIYNFMGLASVDISGCKNITEELLSKAATQYCCGWKDLLCTKQDTDTSDTDESLDKLLNFEHSRLAFVQQRDRFLGMAGGLNINIHHQALNPVAGGPAGDAIGGPVHMFMEDNVIENAWFFQNL